MTELDNEAGRKVVSLVDRAEEARRHAFALPYAKLGIPDRISHALSNASDITGVKMKEDRVFSITAEKESVGAKLSLYEERGSSRPLVATIGYMPEIQCVVETLLPEDSYPLTPDENFRSFVYDAMPPEHDIRLFLLSFFVCLTEGIDVVAVEKRWKRRTIVVTIPPDDIGKPSGIVTISIPEEWYRL